jgi:uncharacterized protein
MAAYALFSLSATATIALKRFSGKASLSRGLGNVARTTPAPGNPFHLAIPVHDMKEARDFYGGILNLPEGRRSEDKWQDYSMFGHQIVCHYVGKDYRCGDYYNPVDGDEVPVPHFGAVLTLEQFNDITSRLKKAGIQFIIPPTLRFKGAPGEQWTCFFKDPSGNNLEFKHVIYPENLFAKYNVTVTEDIVV